MIYDDELDNDIYAFDTERRTSAVLFLVGFKGLLELYFLPRCRLTEEGVPHIHEYTSNVSI